RWRALSFAYQGEGVSHEPRGVGAICNMLASRKVATASAAEAQREYVVIVTAAIGAWGIRVPLLAEGGAMWTINRRARTFVVAAITISVGTFAARADADTTFPSYDHVFLIVEENHGFSQIIGNPAAPNLNHLANQFGLATASFSVADPSAPNYVAMLGGSTFG